MLTVLNFHACLFYPFLTVHRGEDWTSIVTQININSWPSFSQGLIIPTRMWLCGWDVDKWSRTNTFHVFFFFKLSVCNSLEATEISETEWREDSIFHAGGGISFLSSGLYCIWIELAAATTIFLSNLRMKFLLNVVD